MSQRLLAGIIAAPPRKKKRFDRLTKEEIWERRKQRAAERGIDLEALNDESFESENMGTLENRYGSDSIEPGLP